MTDAYGRFPLEPDRATMEDWLARTAKVALDHVSGLECAAAMGLLGAEGNRLAAELSVPIPEEPLEGGVDAALDIVRRAAAASLTTPGPGYLAYVPGGGLYAAALADLTAGCFNRFTGLAAAAPGFARLEMDVIAWLAREFGYGTEARGIFTSGGSLANFSAVVTARHERFGDTGDFRRAVAYCSTQVHHSVTKSLRLGGIPSAGARAIAVDSSQRMDVRALRQALASDRAAGAEPFLVVASAGTTNTGAIDPLPELAALGREEGLWLHADAAYGGAFVLAHEGRRRLAGIELADSITFDPHKGMFLPYGTGCLLVRSGAALARAHSVAARYLQDFNALERTDEPPSAMDYGPELSRDFRGLRPWLALMLHGARAFRESLAEKLELAERIHARLLELIAAGLPLEVVAAPQLSIVAWRLMRRDHESLQSWNARNAALNRAVNARQRVHLSSTVLPVADGEAYTLRACVLSFRTHARHVDAMLEDLELALGSAP